MDQLAEVAVIGFHRRLPRSHALAARPELSEIESHLSLFAERCQVPSGRKIVAFNHQRSAD